MSDDECEFDSTWEDGDENKTHIKKKMSHSRRRSLKEERNMFAARDMQRFRHSVRDLINIQIDDDDDEVKDYYNLAFYRGEIQSSPDDLWITDFYKNWPGKYEWLEDVHSYIQWLFPIQERGVNWRAHVLSKKEIMHFREDKEAKKKLVQSYKLMLDFYGMSLVDESTGKVERAPNWMDRFENLNRHTHNNLRITRILKCLGTLGLEHYQKPLVQFFLEETLVNGELPNVKQSALDYFMFAVLDKSQRRELVKYAFENFKPQERFVWGPRKVLSGQTTGNISRSAEDQKKREDVPKEDHQNNDVTG